MRGVASLVRAAAAVLILAAFATVSAAPAGAHTVLTASDPAADASLTTGPTRVSATFNEDLQPTFAAMTVVGPDGNEWSTGEPVVKGPVASIAVRPLGPSGKYTVNYRVTSDDGHVVSGSWSFTVTVPSTGTPGPAVSGGDSGGRVPLWPFIIGAVAILGGAVAWGMRRRA